MFDDEYLHVKRPEGDDGKLFPVMFDLPLQPYQADDIIWCSDRYRNEEDEEDTSEDE